MPSMPAQLLGDLSADNSNFSPTDLPSDHRAAYMTNPQYRSLHHAYINAYRVTEMVESLPAEGPVHKAAIRATLNAKEHLYNALIVAAQTLLLDGGTGNALRADRNWCYHCDGWEQH